MKKFILSLLSIFGCILFFSHPVFAVSITTNVDPTGRSWKFASGLRCTVDDPSTGSVSTVVANQYNECNLPVSATHPFYLRNFYLTNNIPTVEGNYYSFIVGFATSGGIDTIWWNPNVPPNDWTLFEFDEITDDSMLDTVGDAFSSEHWAYMWHSKFWRVTLQAKRTGNTRLEMGNEQGSPRSLMIFDSSQLSVSEVFEYIPTGNTAIIEELQGVRSDTQAQTREIESGNQEAQDRWESDKEEESQREQDLTDQSDDVSISAQNPGNPFASLFITQDCQSLPTISSWFNTDSPMQVCSPYPAQIKPVIQFVSSALVIGLLIRLYFKLFKGGYSS